jgi:hypothetical protein
MSRNWETDSERRREIAESVWKLVLDEMRIGISAHAPVEPSNSATTEQQHANEYDGTTTSDTFHSQTPHLSNYLVGDALSNPSTQQHDTSMLEHDQLLGIQTAPEPFSAASEWDLLAMSL